MTRIAACNQEYRMRNRIAVIACFVASFVMVPAALAQDKNPLAGYAKKELAFSSKTNNLTVAGDKAGFTLTSTGGDPYVVFKDIGEFHNPRKTYVVAFEYTYAKRSGKVDLYYQLQGQRGSRFGATLKKAEAWTWFMIDISKKGKGLGAPLQWMRIDPPPPGMKIRNMSIVEADETLRRRVALGSIADKLDTLGVSTKGVNADACGMETVRHADKHSISIVRSVYAHLDLDARTKQVAEKKHVKALVPLGPAIAAGEGEHPDNHTVVRILDRYQLREVQFLAYPPSVKGGVGINALALGKESYGFVCHPLTDKTTRALKIFNRYGGQVREINVEGVVPPFIVAAGDFYVKNPGHEIAVASRYAPDTVIIYSASGKKLGATPVPAGKKSAAGYHMTVVGNTGKAGKLLFQDMGARKLYAFDGSSAFSRSVDIEKLPGTARVYASAFPDKLLNAGHRQDVISTLYSVEKSGRTRSYDAGLRENSFFYRVAKGHGGSKEPWPDEPDSKYVRKYESDPYFQAQDWSPLIKTGNIRNRTRAEWLAGLDWNERNFLAKHLRRMGKPMDRYAERGASVWSANFTHRIRLRYQMALINRKGEKGLPEYLCLDRRNEMLGGGYFGHDMFRYGSYNFEQPELHDFYHLVLWEFYRQLAAHYRKKPENTIAVKPSHENEVQSGPGSLGDYNLQNIRGFYRYLLAMHGDRNTINTVFGTSYTDAFFDPPRNFKRGAWDAYSDSNPLFREWVEYNRINVYRRVGESLLGTLLAGFPPQLLRIHQIPDRYITKATVGIMDNAKRITPVDWFLTAGTGFGYTRYGLWYENKRNMAQGAWSSGFDDYFNGEYTSKTGDERKAWEQLKYGVERGMKGANVMAWPDPKHIGLNTTMMSALKRLHKEYGNRPIPGLAGGISDVRAYKGASGTYDIAALGCTEKNTGLLKSVRADGNFEGTVYVVPFHSHVDIKTLVDKTSHTVGAKPVRLCNLKKIRQGCVVEITFTVPEGAAGEVEVQLLRNNKTLAGQGTVVKDLAAGKRVRILYKFPIIMNDVSIALVSRKGTVRVENMTVYRHQDMALNLTSDIWKGRRHKGGVTFDVIPE